MLGKKAPLGEQVTEAVNSGLSGLNEAAAQADEHLLPHLQVAVARAGESVSNFFVDLGLTGPHATPSFATTGAPSALRAEDDADEPPPPPPEGFVGVYVPPATEAPPRYSTGGGTPFVGVGETRTCGGPRAPSHQHARNTGQILTQAQMAPKHMKHRST